MHWFDHFLTKLSKYLWIKTGDRHYHFVEPWVIDRPFCRMETLYRSHFVETGVGSLQNGAPQPPPGNGKEDLESIYCSKVLYLVAQGSSEGLVKESLQMIVGPPSVVSQALTYPHSHSHPKQTSKACKCLRIRLLRINQPLTRAKTIKHH